MKIQDFDYPLPEGRIAQNPASARDGSRLLCVPPEGSFADRKFTDLADALPSKSLLVLNDTRVFPARLTGVRDTGGRIEILLSRLLERSGSTGAGFAETWTTVCRPTRRLRPGVELNLRGAGGSEIRAEVLGVREGGEVQLSFRGAGYPGMVEACSDLGSVPLPPYIQRPNGPMIEDDERYQTVYAARPGAVAAPTAGLHFTPAMLDGLAAAGFELACLTLHVGPGTFLPVRTETIDDHVMHHEWYDLPASTADAVRRAARDGRSVVSVGTTTLRVLEACATGPGAVEPGQGETDLFVRPGFSFQVVDILLTNFHLPRTTLLMLVSAFAGRERILDAYRHAVRQGYRFYSYGDATLLHRTRSM